MKDNLKKSEDSNCHVHQLFTKGYGKFPYVILKVGHAIYMQIPIHFNKNNDLLNYPGTQINNIDEVDLEAAIAARTAEAIPPLPLNSKR